jgi:hypothetical protein
MAESKTDAIIGLIGALAFGICAIVVPFLKMTGFGFITDSESALGITITMDIFWDGAGIKMTGVPVQTSSFSDFVSPNMQIIWDIAALWMFVFIGIGLLGFLLVLIPPVQKLAGMEPAGLGTIGLLLGLVATVVHYLLIVLGALLDEAFTGGVENLNIIVLVLMVVGWAGLFVGKIFGSRD